MFLMVIGGFTQIPDFLLQRLEKQYPVPVLSEAPYGIIILGGGLEARNFPGPHDYKLTGGSDRLIKGLALKQRFSKSRLVFTGGNANLLEPGMAEADAVKKLTRDLFGSSFDIEFERKSRTTFENALNLLSITSEAERKNTWLLVTSAWHMPRAMGVFKKLGYSTQAYPVDYASDEIEFPYLASRASVQFGKLELAAKEIIGIVVYWFSGRFESLS